MTRRLARRLARRVHLSMLAAVLTALLTVGGCSHATRLTSAARLDAVAAARAEGADAAAIREARARSNAGIAAHDAAALAAEWMDDIVVVTSAGLQLHGREENVRRFADQFRTLPGVWYRRDPDSVRVWQPWGMAAEYGRWRGGWSQGDERVEVGGVYFAKWQRKAGRWLIQAETYVPTTCRGERYCAPRSNGAGML